MIDNIYEEINSEISEYSDIFHPSLISRLECKLCSLALDLVNDFLGDQFLVNTSLDILVAVCSIFLLPSNECRGFILNNAPIVIQNSMAVPLNATFFCSQTWQVCTDSPYTYLDPTTYVQEMLSDKPEFIQQDDYIDNLYNQMKESKSQKLIKMLHLTDIHMDFYYQKGTNKYCDDILCCRNYTGFPSDPDSQASEYGEYHCDIPIITVQNMFEYINQNIDPDVVFWTGDVPPHDQWDYNTSYVQSYQIELQKLFDQYFEKYTLYPLEGNHDFGVPNSQGFQQQDPMIPFFMKLWDKYLDQQALDTFQNGGYYSQILKLKDGTEYKKVRIIAINTQPCYNMNFYLWSERDDPGNVLEWLSSLLKQMEQNGEIGVIISHLPPGRDACMYSWAIRYRSILERYQHIIRLAVYGHVHYEYYGIGRGFQSNKPIGVQYWTGSVSTWEAVNPSFRVFYVDSETMLPVKAESYYFNISESSQWKFSHEITEFYNMTDLSPSSFDYLSQRFLQEEDLAVKFTQAKSQGGEECYIESCDQDCRVQLYCETRNSVYFDAKDCENKTRIDFKNEFLGSFLYSVSNPWYSQ